MKRNSRATFVKRYEKFCTTWLNQIAVETLVDFSSYLLKIFSLRHRFSLIEVNYLASMLVNK